MKLTIKRNLLNGLAMLASPRWTVTFFLLTALTALAVAHELMTATALMAAPFILLVINLMASLVTHARFRADLPLLLFHLALLGLVALLVFARLVYLEGNVTLTGGTAFDGELQKLEYGPLHPGRVQDLHFSNDGFNEDFYAQGRGKHKATYNRVSWQDGAGHWQSGKIGDDQPLLLNGYRIYTTRYRGFSPVFEWQANGRENTPGTVQLNALQTEDYAASARWTLPAGPEVWVMLETPSAAQQQTGKRANLGAGGLNHHLILRIGEQRFELEPGQSITLPEGFLTYVRLNSWMGYQITYDPTLPWIMAVILIGLVSLVWFYWRRIW